MAQSTQVHRVVFLPLLTDDSRVDDLFTIPALTQAASNGWFTTLYAHADFYGYQAPPAAMLLERAVRIDLLTTPANDANLVATSLPALQSQLSLPDPLITWSETVTGGY